MESSATQEELEAGRGYEALFVPALFEPWAKHLIAGARVAEGSHVLDVACGSGVLTRYALARSGPSGRVAGIDPAPGMIAAGYDKHYTVGVIATSGSLGILIPPSIPMIVYADAVEESVGKLFIAGIIPGLVMSSFLLVTTYVVA